MDSYNGERDSGGGQDESFINQMGIDKDEIMEDTPKDTLMEELLDQLPSKQMERVVEIASHNLKKRKHSVIHTRSLKRGQKKNVDMEVFKSLQDTMEEDQINDNVDHTLRVIPTSLSRRRHLKKQVSQTDARKIGRCRSLQYRLGMGWQHFVVNFKAALGLFDLWRSHLHTIEGTFGTGVLSYFIFLQWLLIINVPLFLLTAGFLIIPQFLYRFHQRDPRGYDDAKAFTAKELLTGSGFFEQTEMYYGFYTNETVEVIDGAEYEMKYAYLLTCGGYYMFCFIILGYVYLRSYRKYYIETSGDNLNYYIVIFCGWDYSITNQETCELKNKSLYNELKEFLSGKKFMKSYKERDIEWKARCKVWLQRSLVWIMVLGLLAASGYAAYVTSVELSLKTAKANESSIPVVSTMAMPVVISSLYLVVPMIFTFLEAYETYSQPKYELYIHMFREMSLKATVLGVLVYFWFDIAAVDIPCWETFVGQEIYRLVIVDLIFTLGYSFFMEFVRKLLSLKTKRIERSEFAIGRHTLGLIYSQSLCWFGVFFCPVLPFIVILKLIIIFYVRRYSVVQNCKSSIEPWRASRTHTVFMGYLFFFFILSCAAANCCIFLIEPSKHCGPYKSYDTTYEVIELLIGDWKRENSGSRDFFDFIVSPGLIALYIIVLSVLVYFMRTVMLSHKALVEQLKTQVISEGKDKRFLINLLNQIRHRGRRAYRLQGPQLAKAMKDIGHDEVDTQSDGKVFARVAAETIMNTAVQ